MVRNFISDVNLTLSNCVYQIPLHSYTPLHSINKFFVTLFRLAYVMTAGVNSWSCREFGVSNLFNKGITKCSKDQYPGVEDLLEYATGLMMTCI